MQGGHHTAHCHLERPVRCARSHRPEVLRARHLSCAPQPRATCVSWALAGINVRSAGYNRVCLGQARLRVQAQEQVTLALGSVLANAEAHDGLCAVPLPVRLISGGMINLDFLEGCLGD